MDNLTDDDDMDNPTDVRYVAGTPFEHRKWKELYWLESPMLDAHYLRNVGSMGSHALRKHVRNGWVLTCGLRDKMTILAGPWDTREAAEAAIQMLLVTGMIGNN